MVENIINPRLTECQMAVDGPRIRDVYNQPMVEKTTTFAERFLQLKGAMSYDDLSDAVHEKTGVRVSGQAMHKWVKGGGISIDNVQAVARYFDVSPAWLLFGEGEGPQTNHLSAAIGELPKESRQQVLDFITYKFEKSEGLIASDRLADYLKMIDAIRRDMEKRKNGDH